MKIVRIFSLLYKIYLGLILSITALLFYPFLAYTTTREKHHLKAFKGFVIWSSVFRFFAGWWFKIEGKIPTNTPFIIVANHASYADIFLTPSLFSKQPHIFLGKSEILSYPMIRMYFKSFNIPVFRENKIKAAKSLILARKKLQNNWSLIIFPEGGIPDHERPMMLPFKDGAFKLAKETNTPILPITFSNNYLLFTDPTDLFGACRPGASKVTIHPLIDREEIEQKTAEELRDKAFQLINSRLKQVE